MIASDVINRARYIAQDMGSTLRTSDAEMLLWLSDAQFAVVLYKPDAYPVIGNIQLTANTVRQQLPAGGVQLLYLTHNMGAGGTTPGTAIRPTTIKDMTDSYPSWPTQTGAEVKHYMSDDRSPQHFYVYPAPTSTLYVAGAYAGTPTDVTATGQTLTLQDIYRGPLVDYLVHRIFLKDTEDEANRDISQTAFAMFKEKLGAKDAQERNEGPTGR